MDAGTQLVAYVPSSLRNRIGKACERAGTAFEGEAPAIPAELRVPTGAKRKRSSR